MNDFGCKSKLEEIESLMLKFSSAFLNGDDTIVKNFKTCKNDLLYIDENGLLKSSVVDILESLQETIIDMEKSFSRYSSSEYGFEYNDYLRNKDYLNYHFESGGSIDDEYLTMLQKFLVMRRNMEWVRDYKKYKSIIDNISIKICELKRVNLQIENAIRNFYDNEKCLSHDILFLQRYYTYNIPEYCYPRYYLIDYYKALDCESLRSISKNANIGSWIMIRFGCPDGEKYRPLYGTSYSYGHGIDIHKVHNEHLKAEIDDIKHNSQYKVIQKVLEDKYVIVANSILDYDILMKEYYSNFGMDPLEFVKMVQDKYGCEIICPDVQKKKVTSTKVMVLPS